MLGFAIKKLCRKASKPSRFSAYWAAARSSTERPLESHAPSMTSQILAKLMHIASPRATTDIQAIAESSSGRPITKCKVPLSRPQRVLQNEQSGKNIEVFDARKVDPVIQKLEPHGGMASQSAESGKRRVTAQHLYDHVSRF